MNVVAFVTALGLGLMLAESRVSRAHERTLRARGAVAPPGDLYALVAVVYPALFLAMGIEGMWRAAQQTPATGIASAAGGPAWFASGLLLFVASKALKYWSIRALGDRWTFRVMVLPGAPLVTDGPYRFVAHPNFVAVVGELAGAAMMCGAGITGPIGIGLYAVILWMRARFEERALKEWS